MKHSTLLLIVTVIALPQFDCDSKSNSADQGREAVKEVVTQPFNTLENATKSLKESEEKTKAALEQAEKESN
jgi:ABC-type transporter MlaC component